MQNDFTDKLLDAGTTTIVNSLKKTLDNPDFFQSSFGKLLTAAGVGAFAGFAGAYAYEKYFNPNRISAQDLQEIKLLIQQNTLQQQKLQFQQQMNQGTNNGSQEPIITITPENVDSFK